MFYKVGCAIPVVIASLLLITGIVIGGWQAGWWFTVQNTNRQAHLIQQGYNFQSTLEQQISEGISNVNTVTTEIAQASGNSDYQSSLKAQRESDVATVCQQASEVTPSSVPMPLESQKFVNMNCSGGSVRSSSKYYYVGG